MGRWPKLGILFLLIALCFADQTVTTTNSSSTTSYNTSTTSQNTSSTANTTVPAPIAVGEYLFDASAVYQDMTDTYEVRHLGTIDLPPCIKNLMNCWEMINPDVICKFNETGGWFSQVRFDTICMDLRFQCREYTGPTPFPSDRYIDSLLNYCSSSIMLQSVTWFRWNGDPTSNDGY